jgi:hypothetical protein
MLFYLSLGLALGLVIALMRGFSKGIIDKPVRPNQGILNALSNSTRLALLFGLGFALVPFIFYSLATHNIVMIGDRSEIPDNAAIVYGASDGLAVGYLIWLLTGGFTCIQHGVLRFIIWRSNHAPWNYVRFLNYASGLILLKRDGGGYQYIHDYMRDYFASDSHALQRSDSSA